MVGSDPHSDVGVDSGLWKSFGFSFSDISLDPVQIIFLISSHRTIILNIVLIM